MFPNLDRMGGQARVFSFISTLAMEDEQRLELDALVSQFELLYASLGHEKAMHDPRIARLEREIRKYTAECNDVMIKCPRVVGGRWFFGLHD